MCHPEVEFFFCSNFILKFLIQVITCDELDGFLELCRVHVETSEWKFIRFSAGLDNCRMQRGWSWRHVWAHPCGCNRFVFVSFFLLRKSNPGFTGKGNRQAIDHANGRFVSLFFVWIISCQAKPQRSMLPRQHWVLGKSRHWFRYNSFLFRIQYWMARHDVTRRGIGCLGRLSKLCLHSCSSTSFPCVYSRLTASTTVCKLPRSLL